MLVSRERFSQGHNTRVKLLTDQKVKGLALNEGDTCDLTLAEALYLKSIGRAEIVVADPEKTPKTAAR